MTILVTGASGFVGRGLARYLAAAHPDETVLATDLGPGADLRTGNLRMQSLDVTDRDAVRVLLARERPERVVHAAALTLTDAASRLRVFDVNLGGALNVLDAAAEAGAQRTVLASSSGVYAGGLASIREETDPTDALNPYAASKLAAEAVAACYGGVAVRIGPVYGPDECARPSRPRVSAIGAMTAALRAQRAIRLSGGEVARDWTHVDDVARGVNALLFAPRLAHGVYNLSAGRAETLSAVAAAFARHGLEVRWTDPEAADVVLASGDARAPLSIARLVEDTGFAPRHTIETGIAAVAAAIKQEGAPWPRSISPSTGTTTTTK